MDNQDGSNLFLPNMAYDLRQRYAKIVGDHIEDVAIHRKNRDFQEYFRALEDLHTLTKHKFKDNKKTNKYVSNDKKEKTISITFEQLRKKIIDVSNEYPSAWAGSGTEPKEINEIDRALREMEEFIYFKMNEASMFGSKRDMEGLI